MRLRHSLCIIAILFVYLPARADELKTLTGKSVVGTLDKITETDIVLKTDTTPITTPINQVLDVLIRQQRVYNDKYTEVQLIDESLLRCSKVTFRAKEVELELTSGAIVKVPVDGVLSVLREAQDAEVKKQWTKLMKSKTRSDRIYVLRDGQLNPIDGLIKGIDEKKQTIKFKPDVTAEADYQLDRLHAISFIRTDAPAAESLCKVIDYDGNSLVATKLAFDGKEVTVSTPFGAKVTINPQVLSRLDFNFGRLTYLSDLAGKISDTPFLGGFSALRKDANLDGNPIMLLDKQYPKGLSMYAGVEIAYQLNGKYKEFKAVLGADPRIAEEGQGQVTVTIFCDLEKRFSKVVSAKEVQNIAINVKDVNRLRIVVSGTMWMAGTGPAMTSKGGGFTK